MTRCEVDIQQEKYNIKAQDIPVGKLCEDIYGNIYIRTMYTVTCLNIVEDSISVDTFSNCPLKVRILPKNSKVTLTQE